MQVALLLFVTKTVRAELGQIDLSSVSLEIHTLFILICFNLYGEI